MKTYRMYLNLGDWSGDGHEKHDRILLESNLPVKDVQKAYKDSCKLTGLQLNHNENFTGKKDNSNFSEIGILTEYECSKITNTQFKSLSKHGLTVEMLAKWNYEDVNSYKEDVGDDNGFYIYGQDPYVKFWIWFTSLSNPNLKITVVDDDGIPNINGYWDKHLNVQFGYGIF